MSEYRAKYKRLKAKLKYLVYEQECFVEEMRKTQRKLVRVSRDKSFLLDRLMKYETVPPSSSDDEATASSSSDDDIRNDIKIAHPKAKKRLNDDLTGAPSPKIAALGNSQTSFSESANHRTSFSEEPNHVVSTSAATSADPVPMEVATPPSRVKKVSVSEPVEHSTAAGLDQMPAVLASPPHSAVRGAEVATAAVATARSVSSSSSSDSSSSSNSSIESGSPGPAPSTDPIPALAPLVKPSGPDRHSDTGHTRKHTVVPIIANRYAAVPGSTAAAGARPQATGHALASPPSVQHRAVAVSKTFQIQHAPLKSASTAPLPSSATHPSSSGGSSTSSSGHVSSGASQCKYMLDETTQCTESVNMKSKSPFCTHHRSVIRKKGQAQSYNAARKLPRIDGSGSLLHGSSSSSTHPAHSGSYSTGAMPPGSH